MSKKIALFSHMGSPNYITGAEKNLLFLADELQREYECILIIPNESLLAAEARKKGIEVAIFSHPMMWTLFHPDSSVLVQQEQFIADKSVHLLVNFLLDKRPDLVFTNTCINLQPAVAAKKLGIPVVWWIQEVMDQNEFTQHAVSLIYQYSDLILCLSQAISKPFRKAEAASKTKILYPSWKMEDLAPDTWEQNRKTLRQRLGISETKKLVGFLAAYLSSAKGLDQFIEMALRLCQRTDADYLIAGNPTFPDFYAKCMKAIEGSNFKERFHVLQFEKEIQKVYPSLDILVVPSQMEEGFGLTALEGLIFGKAVVAYQSGGLKEVIGCTGNHEFLVEKGNIEALEKQVWRFITDDSLRINVGSTNQAKVIESFGLTRFREQVESIINEIDQVVKAKYSSAKFPDGTLMKGSSPAVFLVVNGTKRPFADAESFYYFQHKWEQVVNVQDWQLGLYPTGAPINYRSP